MMKKWICSFYSEWHHRLRHDKCFRCITRTRMVFNFFCWPGRNRTFTILIRHQSLYLLRYWPKSISNVELTISNLLITWADMTACITSKTRWFLCKKKPGSNAAGFYFIKQNVSWQKHGPQFLKIAKEKFKLFHCYFSCCHFHLTQ